MKALLLSAALGLWALPVGAQEEAALPVDAPAQEEAAEAQDADTADEEAPGIVEQAVQPGDFVYEVGGRRDPFISLLANVAPGEGDMRVRPPGMPGFLIQEMTLKGIVADRTGFIAMLEGSDSKSYFARVGQPHYDGTITAMDAATVTFRQDVRVPLARERTREVVKSLLIPPRRRGDESHTRT